MTALICALILAHPGVQTQGHTKDATGKEAGHSVPTVEVGTAKSLIGKKAGSFSTVDSKGAAVTLQSLLKKPLVLVFIEKGCPCCKSGKPYFDRIENYYGDVANVVGIVAGSRAGAANWVATTSPQFRVLADSHGSIAKSFHAHAGLFTVLVAPSGKIDKAYPGYSQPMLREITARIAALAKVKDRHMEVRPAPMELTSGCPLDSH